MLIQSQHGTSPVAQSREGGGVFHGKRAANPLRMIRPTSLLISILGLSCLGSPRLATADLLYFASSVAQQGAVAVGEVRAGPTVLLRFRGADPGEVASRARLVAQRLQQQALQGLAASSIQVAPLGSTVTIMADKTLLLTVDPATANLAQSPRRALAEQWAENLRQALAGPYLCLDIDGKLTVPLSESRQVRYGGTYAGKLTATSDAADLISVVVDDENRLLVVSGLARGVARITVSAAEISGSFPVECLPWAGEIQHFVAAQLTASEAPEAVMRPAVLNAILSNVSAAPGATVTIEELRGRSPNWEAAVVISSPDHLRRAQTVTVTPTLVSRPDVTPDCVLVSNEPEKVTEPQTLLRQMLLGARSCRLLWHHVNAAHSPLTFIVRVVNLGEEPASVYIVGAQAGPSHDEIYTGHLAMYHFWRTLLGSIGYIATVPPGTVWEAYRCSAHPSRIVSGVSEFANLGSQPLLIEMLAISAPDPLPLVTIDPDADHLRKLSDFEYPGSKSAELVHEIGGAWGFFHVGKRTPDADMVQLAGHYGVMYDVAAQVVNRSQQQARFEIAVIASGGAGRGLYLIDGQLVDTGPMRPLQEGVIFRGWVGAGATKSIPIQTIPQSGSNYPVTLVLRSFTR